MTLISARDLSELNQEINLYLQVKTTHQVASNLNNHCSLPVMIGYLPMLS